MYHRFKISTSHFLYQNYYYLKMSSFFHNDSNGDIVLFIEVVVRKTLFIVCNTKQGMHPDKLPGCAEPSSKT